MALDNYGNAKKRVAQKKAFYTHLALYFTINSFLFAVNMFTFHGKFWFVYPLLGWGISIAIQYFLVFGIPGTGHLDETWEADQIEKELRRMKAGGESFEPEPEDELELKEVRKARKDWDDSDLV